MCYISLPHSLQFKKVSMFYYKSSGLREHLFYKYIEDEH